MIILHSAILVTATAMVARAKTLTEARVVTQHVLSLLSTSTDPTFCVTVVTDDTNIIKFEGESEEVIVVINTLTGKESFNSNLLKMCKVWLLATESSSTWLITHYLEYLQVDDVILAIVDDAKSIKQSILPSLFSRLSFITMDRQLYTRENSKSDFIMVSMGNNLDFKFIYSQEKLYQGEEVRAAAFHYPPYTKYNGQGEVLGGMEYKIMDAIMRAMNLTMVVNPPTDGGMWGGELEVGKGNFTGLLGDVRFARVELGWANLFIQRDRLKYMDFTEWHLLDRACAMVPRPESYSKLLALILPFDRATWVLLLVCWVSVVLFYIIHYELALTKTTTTNTILPMILAFVLSVSYPSIRRMHTLELRACTLIVLFCFLVLARGYAGSLTSMLSTSHYPPNINTFDELVKSHKEERVKTINICCTGIFTLLKESSTPALTYIAEHSTLAIGSKSSSMRAVSLKKEQAYWYTEQNLDFFIRRELLNERGEANVNIMSECILPSRIAYAMRKRSLLTANINNKIQRLRETGFLNKYLRNELESEGIMKESRSTETKSPEPLGWEEMERVIVVLAIMIFVSMIMLLIEIGFIPTLNGNKLISRHVEM